VGTDAVLLVPPSQRQRQQQQVAAAADQSKEQEDKEQEDAQQAVQGVAGQQQGALGDREGGVAQGFNVPVLAPVGWLAGQAGRLLGSLWRR